MATFHTDAQRYRVLAVVQSFATPMLADDGRGIDPSAVLEGNFYVGPHCRIGRDSRIEDGTTLTSNVRVLGATVRRSVVWGDTEIGEGSVVEGALLANGVRVHRHCRVLPGAALGDGTVLSDHSRTS